MAKSEDKKPKAQGAPVKVAAPPVATPGANPKMATIAHGTPAEPEFVTQQAGTFEAHSYRDELPEHLVDTATLAPLPLTSDEDLSDLPEALQMAIVCFGLKRENVLDHRLTEDGVVIITRGGKKLQWPGDEEKAAALSATDKDGISRSDFPAANLMGKPKA